MVIYKKNQPHKDVDGLQIDQIQNNSIKKTVWNIYSPKY